MWPAPFFFAVVVPAAAALPLAVDAGDPDVVLARVVVPAAVEEPALEVEEAPATVFTPLI